MIKVAQIVNQFRNIIDGEQSQLTAHGKRNDFTRTLQDPCKTLKRFAINASRLHISSRKRPAIGKRDNSHGDTVREYKIVISKPFGSGTNQQWAAIVGRPGSMLDLLFSIGNQAGPRLFYCDGFQSVSENG